MIDFTPLTSRQMRMPAFQAQFSVDDLRHATDAMIDKMLALIADCVDADVVFEPVDEGAHDSYASDDADISLAWTLGHVIVHVTASSEESAALAAELARGVGFHGRSRSEVDWETVTTMAQCRQRLEESRRMRLASLDMWPDEPHLKNAYVPWSGAGRVNAFGRFLLGLLHDSDHLDQIADIVRQAHAARVAA